MKKLIMAIGVAGLGVVSSAQIGDVQLKGRLGECLARMIERHVVGTDVDYITAPFLEKTERRYWWQSEFWGKYMHSAVPYSMYLEGGKGTREELKGKIERGVDRMLSSQEPCGYIGNYPEELRCGEGWDVWGIKYTMMGLLHYYDGEQGSEKGKRALESCRRLCDYVIAEIGPNGKRGRELWQTGNWSGYASSSILEPVVWLYKRTKDRKYLDFAAYIVKGMTEPKDGPLLLDMALKGVSVADRNDPGYNMNGEWSYVCKKGRSKAYEMMSCYQGFLEYFEVTGRKDLFEAAVKTGEDIIKEEVNLAGGCASSEAWFHGARKQHLPYERLQETCVTTTWMRYCEKLLDMTGDSRWADQIERTFYNSYLAAMKADGSEFAGYTPLSGNRWHGQHHCFMHTDCCTANGPRGFLCFLKKLFRVKDGAAEFNFYASALAKGELSDGRKVAFDMYSLYPRSEKARIVSHTENVGMVPLKLRIPAWSTSTVVKLNGKELPGAKGGTYFTLEHEWKLGDVVEIEFAMPVVAHKVSHHVAFTRGPVLLARDSRFGDGDMTEPFRWRDIEDGKFTENFNAVRTPSGEMWMAFSATLPVGTHHENPEAALPTTVNFCDYASAGNRWERDNYYRTWFPVEFGPAD
jgi:DUF1680 family protein